MKKVFLLYIMNLKEIFRDLKRNLLYFFLPIVIFIGFFTYFQMNKVELVFIKPVSVGVIVEEETIFGQMLIDDFRSKKELSQFFKLVQAQPSQLNDMFENKEIDALVTIPKGFVKSLMSFSYLPIEVMMHQDDPVKTLILYQGFRGYERYIQSVEKAVTAFYKEFHTKADEKTYWEYNDALSIELITTVLDRTELYELEKIYDTPSIISRDYYFIALTLVFVFYFSMVYAVTLLTEVKSQVFQRLMVSHISIVEYMSAKILVILTSLTGLVVIWTFSYSLFTRETYFYTARVSIALLIIIFLAIEISLCLTLFIRNEHDFFMLSSVVIFFNAVVGGSIVPIHFMPDGLKLIAKFTPNFQCIKIILLLKNDIPIRFYGLAGIGFCIISILFIVIIRGYKALLKGGKLV